MSGRRELNPVCLYPKQVYYRYTTARCSVGEPTRVNSHYLISIVESMRIDDNANSFLNLSS